MRHLGRMRRLLLLAVLSPACVVYDADSDVIVAWDFAGLTCGEAGVSVVHVELEGVGTGEIHRAEPVPCEQGSFVFRGLFPEDYLVYVEGEAEPGVVTWALYARLLGDVHLGENLFELSLLPVER